MLNNLHFSEDSNTSKRQQAILAVSERYADEFTNWLPKKAIFKQKTYVIYNS